MVYPANTQIEKTKYTLNEMWLHIARCNKLTVSTLRTTQILTHELTVLTVRATQFDRTKMDKRMNEYIWVPCVCALLHHPICNTAYHSNFQVLSSAEITLSFPLVQEGLLENTKDQMKPTEQHFCEKSWVKQWKESRCLAKRSCWPVSGDVVVFLFFFRVTTRVMNSSLPSILFPTQQKTSGEWSGTTMHKL